MESHPKGQHQQAGHTRAARPHTESRAASPHAPRRTNPKASCRMEKAEGTCGQWEGTLGISSDPGGKPQEDPQKLKVPLRPCPPPPQFCLGVAQPLSSWRLVHLPCGPALFSTGPPCGRAPGAVRAGGAAPAQIHTADTGRQVWMKINEPHAQLRRLRFGEDQPLAQDRVALKVAGP